MLEILSLIVLDCLMIRQRARACAVRSAGFSSSSSNLIDWEDLPPAPEIPLVEDPEEVLTKQQRFYVPPPYTDAQLMNMSWKQVSEWPKSRVVWALGRLGYIARSEGYETASLLLRRADELGSTLNTRDITRILQAVAYGPQVADPSVIHRLRRYICSNIEGVNELFLVSLIYGHLKLLGRIDWSVSANCNKTTQFLLSELIHRKAKIDAGRFLEVTSCLLTNTRVLQSHSDSVDMILRHAAEHSLKHCKRETAIIEKFGKAICNVPNQHLFVHINDILSHKFNKKQWRSADEALRVGFYFYLADLMSVRTLGQWLNVMKNAATPLSANSDCGQMVALVRIIVDQRNQSSLVEIPTKEWLDGIPLSQVSLSTASVVGFESLHVGSVLRRMVQATVADGLEPMVVGPFNLSVADPATKKFIEWTDQAELETPHKRGVARAIEGIKRRFLESEGWTLVSLNRSDFKAGNDGESLRGMNDRFANIVKEKLPHISLREDVAEPAGADSPKTIHLERADPNTSPERRERREARSRAWRMKSQLKSISKQFHKKARRKLRKTQSK